MRIAQRPSVVLLFRANRLSDQAKASRSGSMDVVGEGRRPGAISVTRAIFVPWRGAVAVGAAVALRAAAIFAAVFAFEKRSRTSLRRCGTTTSSATTNTPALKIAQFTDGLATQYGQLFKALSNRLDAVEREAFGPNYSQEQSTPHLN